MINKFNLPGFIVKLFITVPFLTLVLPNITSIRISVVSLFALLIIATPIDLHSDCQLFEQ